LPAASIDLTDVQGLVRFGYKHHTEACYLLLRIRDAAAARAWCAAAQVATANDRPSDAVLQVAFTFPGLRALGLPDEVLAGFSSEFQSGMVGDESRSRRLGDVGSSAPENWCWGGPENIPDVLVMLFALPGKLEPFRRTVEDAGWNQAFELMRCLDTIDLKGFEPFGFKDGISQPEIDWPYSRNVKNQIFYTNVVAAGEFLLGYRNEYGKYTDRPLVDSTSPAAAVLPEAEDMPAKKDVGRNGSFVVMRTLGQDVRGFWDFLDAQAASDPVARKQLAEKMVGRRIEGDPLVEKSAVAIPGISADANRFTFGADSDGTRCPFGAHIRRANPRNGDFPNQPSWWLPRVWSK
jgi:hypothetical protein